MVAGSAFNPQTTAILSSHHSPETQTWIASISKDPTLETFRLKHIDRVFNECLLLPSLTSSFTIITQS
jgi:hypothetical protein